MLHYFHTYISALYSIQPCGASKEYFPTGLAEQRFSWNGVTANGNAEFSLVHGTELPQLVFTADVDLNPNCTSVM